MRPTSTIAVIARWRRGPTPAARKLKTGALLLMGGAAILMVLFFSLRDVVLQRLVEQRIGAYGSRSGHPLVTIVSVGFRGLSRVAVAGVSIRSRDQAVAIDLGAGHVDLSFWRLLIGQIRFKHVELNDLCVRIIQDITPGPGFPRQVESGRAAPTARAAPAAPLAGTARSLPDPGQAPDYGRRASRLLTLFFDRIPDSLVVDRFTLYSDINRIRQVFHIPQLLIRGLHFDAQLGIETPMAPAAARRVFVLTGDIERGERQVAIQLKPFQGGNRSLLPFVDAQWGLRIGFDSVAFRLKSGGLKGGVLQLDGSLAVSGLTLNHPRIAREDVHLPVVVVDYTFHLGPGQVELCSPTRVRFHRLTFGPTARLQTWPTRQLELKLAPTRFSADDFFASLPVGLFRNLEGIKTRGTLTAALDFFVDFSRPDSVRLDGLLDKGDFRLVHVGTTDFRAVNAPFYYTAYEKDQAVRSFPVGPVNPDFRPLDQISPFLRNAVLISEDGAFFGHKGILIDPFRKSITANLREKRFVRGGSTISMQLVKNLYLRRYKTIARKLEEIIITWLIEENRLISKERMYEIYLNIIEWGPGVYGAQAAARFYFDKDAADLTLAEALYMASIVPRPKKFIYLFDQEQRLRPWLESYYRLVSGKMLQRQMIDQQAYDTLLPQVRLRGPARLLLRGEEPPPDEPLDLAEAAEE
jgi:hypothetical protein